MGANAQTSVPAFTSGQVLTAAQVNQINTGIPVFASSTERDAAFGGTGEKTLAEGQMAYLEDTNVTQYYDGSSWIASGGKILQVVSTTKTDTFSASVAVGAVTDVTGLSATITPSASSSKILVMASVQGSNNTSTVYGALTVILKRDSTQISIGDAASNRTRTTASNLPLSTSSTAAMTNVTFNYLDSPSTTSATTYQIEIANAVFSGSTATLYVNRSSSDGDFNYTPRPTSTITVMEVSA